MRQLILPGIETRKQYITRIARENPERHAIEQHWPVPIITELHSVVTPEEHAQIELLYAQFKWETNPP